MKYIIYARKSTDTSDKQALSLEAQISELRNLAKINNLEIVKEFQESQSAKKAGRPIFAEVLQYIQDGKADALLVWKTDRLSRNPIDSGTITHLLQTEVIKEIKTYQKTYYPGDNAIVMAVEFSMANQYIRELSVNVKRGNRAKLRRGGWIGVAPLGYLNDKLNKTVILDPKRARFIKEMFTMYATGNYSFKDMQKILFEKGFKSRGNNKVSHAVLHHCIKNTFYYGIMYSAGEYYKGNHEPLVSKKLFEQCKSIREGLSRPRRKKHVFPFRGLLNCAECGCLITAEKQRGKDYYHCTNGKGICTQKKNFIRGTELEKEIFENIKDFHMTEEMIDIIHDAALEKFHKENDNKEELVESLEKDIEVLKTKESKLIDIMLENKINNDTYASKSKEIKLDILHKEQQIAKNGVDIEEELFTFERAKNAFKTFASFKSDYFESDISKRRISLFEVLSNGTLKDRKVLTLQQKMPFRIIANGPKNMVFSKRLSG